MADRIKGITIELGGDVTGLNKALSGVNREISHTQSQLRDVERMLKMDPGNTELLEQKQRLLAVAISEARDKLETLKKADEEVSGSVGNYDAWKAAYDPVKAQIDQTGAKLKELKARQKEMQDTDEFDTEGYAQLQSEIEETSGRLSELKQRAKDVSDEFGNPISLEQYEGLRRELIESEKTLEGLEKQAAESRTALVKLGDGAQKVSDTAGKLSKAFSPVTKAVGAIGAAAVATVPATEELRSDLSKLDNNARQAGVGIDASREAFKAFTVATDEVDSSVEATSNLLQAGFTESNLQQAVEGLTGAYLRFPDTLKIESLADSLQETLATGTATGQFGELLDRIGVGAENFSAILATVPDQAGRIDLALGTLSRAGLMDSYNGWLQNNQALVESKQANLDAQLAMAQLAETIQPLITQITQLATAFLEWFNGLEPGTQKGIAAMLLLAGAISPVLGAVSGAAGGVSKLVGLFGKLGGAAAPAGTAMSGVSTAAGGIGTALSGVGMAVKSFILGPAGIIIAVAAAAIALTVAWETSEEFRNSMMAFDSWITGVFSTDWREQFGAMGAVLNAFFENISNVYEAIKRILGGVIDFVAGVFSGDWERAWQGVVDIFGGLMDMLAAGAKAPFNLIIGVINGMLEGITSGINGVIGLLNKIQIKLPEWLPVIGGKELGFHLAELKAPQIPFLANGAVLPPNNPFLAVVGDQTHGTNIETPLATMVQAFTTALSTMGLNGGGDVQVFVNFTGSLAQVARILRPEIKVVASRSGETLVEGV